MLTRRTQLLAVAWTMVAAGCAGAASVDEPDATVSPTPTVTVADAPHVDVESPAAAEAGADPDRLATGDRSTARVDLTASGNRWIEGAGSITATEPVAVFLGDRRPHWILPAAAGSWIVVLDDGSTVDITLDGGVPIATTGLPAGSVDVDVAPPLLVDGVLVAQAASLDAFLDPLPDTRTVTDGERVFALGGPSDRYAHGVLGDAIEATTIEVIGVGEPETIVELAAPDVFEAVSPTLADVDGDGDVEVIATAANDATGARVVVYETDGSVSAETSAIGRGNRWRNLLAVAPIGPNGEIELIDVQTPHIGGILQFFRADGAGRLELMASARSYSTHSIGSRNLDLGIVTDADGDGHLDVLLPTQDQRSLAVVTRDETEESGTRETFVIELGARIATNLAARADGEVVSYAIGLDDGRVLVWPAAP